MKTEPSPVEQIRSLEQSLLDREVRVSAIPTVVPRSAIPT